jgi:uncharacterized protein YxjI
MNPKLIVEQKITAFVNKYAIYSANPDGGKNAPVAFVQQKRLAFKEKVSFYDDEQKTNLLFTFRAEKVLDVHGRYIIEDSDGLYIGAFKKEFKKSLINSTWNILDGNNNPVITVSESNQTLAAIRRFGGFIPFVGDVIDILVLFLRYHFVFKDSADSKEVGMYKKTTLFRDHYLLSMTDTAYEQQDWRVLAGIAVALDALQSR